ncbi:MAG: AprI/Inh family metalloprotease inhibitor [Caulobacteraceae bacterium]
MRSHRIWLFPALAVLALAGAAQAADNEAGVPLSPREAAGAWTLESQNRDICRVDLGARRAGKAGYRVRIASDCGASLPAGATAWVPTRDGMALVGSDGTVLIGFNRWSNSLFASHRSSGVDLMLRRGPPHSPPAT